VILELGGEERLFRTAIFSKQEPLKTINGFPNDFAKRFTFADELKRDSAEEGRVITRNSPISTWSPSIRPMPRMT